MIHPLDSPNTDHGCRWLCLTNGNRRREDEAKLAAFVKNCIAPVPRCFFPTPEEIQRRVK